MNLTDDIEFDSFRVRCYSITTEDLLYRIGAHTREPAHLSWLKNHENPEHMWVVISDSYGHPVKTWGATAREALVRALLNVYRDRKIEWQHTNNLP